MEKQVRIRRYEFDWLRVLAFGLLIFYHTGMFFVSWDWHIKNNELSKTLEWPMLFLSQWRMSLIFLVSGAGVYFALGYRSGGAFAKDRLKRILLPLVVGILIIVPPQVYFERLTQGFSGSYLDFYTTIFTTGPYPTGNFSWHHLWYLAYIFTYSLLLLPALLYLRGMNRGKAGIKKWMVLLLPALWLSLGGVLLNERFPTTGALVDDWASHFLYVSIFLFGFMLMKFPALQEKVRAMRWYSLATAIISVSILYTSYWIDDQILTGVHLWIYFMIKQSNRWFWLMAIVGFAMQHLNIRCKYLQQANEMIYPFYILHQTVIVVMGYFLQEVPLAISTKFWIISLGTFLICFLLVHYLIMQVNWLRVPFGLKAQKNHVQVVTKQVKVPEATTGVFQ